MAKKTPRAYGYLRVSTADQAVGGLGLDAQRAAVEAVAGRLGLALENVYVDAGLSGALPLDDRPGLMAAVAALRRGDVLAVAKRDRIGRDVLNVALAERLVERKGAKVVSAAGEGTDTDGPTGVLMRTVVDAFAQYERALIASRTKAALRAKRSRGERAGNIPFGYRVARDGRTLVPCPAERAVLDRIADLRAAGHSLRAIANALNESGATTRRGTPWRHQYVAAVGGGVRLGGSAKRAVEAAGDDRADVAA